MQMDPALFRLSTEELTDKLQQLRWKAMPFASRNAINRTAFRTRALWQADARKTMTLRNQYTTRSILVEQTRGTFKVDEMHAVVGSEADYMKTQEFGALLNRRGAQGKPIPTTVASGEGRAARPRRKVVRRPNKLRMIELQQRVKSGSRGSRNSANIRKAKAAGTKYVFLELQRRKGIFRLSGSKKKPKLDMIWDMSRPFVRIKKNPMLGRSLTKVERETNGIWRKALREQITRWSRK